MHQLGAQDGPRVPVIAPPDGVVIDDEMVDRGARALHADIARESLDVGQLRLGPFDEQSAASQARWRRWSTSVLEGALATETER